MQSQFVVKEIIIFSIQKCSNFVPICANFDFKAHANKIQYDQFQNNMHVVEKAYDIVICSEISTHA